MNKQELIDKAAKFVEHSRDNRISAETAISEEVVGLKMFDQPLISCARADDEYFRLLKLPEAIGQHFMLPQEWLPEAQTVISFFLPFSADVRAGNTRESSWPSPEWLHGRIEGQQFINKLCAYLVSALTDKGYESVAPSIDQRFWAKTGTAKKPQDSAGNADTGLTFTSNWSERHVAYVCGLGSFGLSKGLITAKGVAGRFGSIITSLALPVDQRMYKDTYEYCTKCGACASNCPVQAISLEAGKDHRLCSDFLDVTAQKYKPRYGCGKCQVGVPCEDRIPTNN